MLEIMLEILEEFEGYFWTRLEDLKESLEEKGFCVEELNREYVTVYRNEEEYEDAEWVLSLGGSNRTITVERVEEIR